MENCNDESEQSFIVFCSRGIHRRCTGAILIMSQPAQSKNDKAAQGDGMITTLGF
jgi:hypothetical protein